MLPRLLLIVAVSATVLGGCVFRDPLVHGPFMIGAEQAPAGGAGCRPGAVRSQSAANGWIEDCAAVTDATAVAPPPKALQPLPSAAPTALPPYAGRSAWH